MKTQAAENLSQHDLNEKYEKRQIRNFFSNRTGGTCVEVGANEPLSVCSQSLHLERQLNWRCILIEPNPLLAQKARALRPDSLVCEAACTSPEHVGMMQLNIPLDAEGREITGHAGLEKNADEHFYHAHKTVDVRADTLADILHDHDITALDFLSIDVEGAELDVLLGFDFMQYHPRLILLEDKHLYLQKHRLLKQNGYKLVRRLNRNCWYIPQEIDSPPVPLRDRFKLWKRMYISIWFKKLHYAWRHKTLKPFKSL
ncbi:MULTISPECIES: FkbM family methyltransferase [Methylomicrobium]|uniref:Methyltransferase, FkbM family n=1 Tax=Methylomicrobium album BG8 TaxID=686340 RepID=H8GQ66_METAL|nr:MULTISPECIES: FkbM family methyltransferase [Methylomicrobium]EIC31006.1 methyltransferase, FkbM family [Methylomicrobium album BG8]